ncbi:Gamma-tubulin complex component protein [Phytophthora cactorum]|nr:Gamma-tubulin complex component protein [Phytophthora cactorum]
MQDELPPPPPPPPVDSRSRSLSSNPAGLVLYAQLRAGGLLSRSSSLHVDVKDDDPLSPRTRLEMEKQRQAMGKTTATSSGLNTSAANTSNTTPTNHSSTRSTPRSSSFYSVSSSLEFAPTGGRRFDLQTQHRNPSNQLSPHRAMLSRVDSLLGSQPPSGPSPGASSQYGGASFVATHSMYSASSTSTSPSLATSTRTFHRERGEEQREPSSCGAEILYNSPIRLRLSSRQCLRISAVKDSNHQSHATSHFHRGRRDQAQEQINVSGDGLDGDADQIFVLQNTALRSDCGEVHYSDIVSLYCVGGSCKGQFLSVDPATQTLTMKKGPVISNSEKWRLVNPISEGREDYPVNNQDSFASVDAASRLVMLKMNTAELYLSVRPDRYGQDDSAGTHTASVVLSKENDGINDTMQVWKVTKSNLPYDPEWNRERPYLTGEAFVQPQAKRHHTADDGDLNLPPLSTYPPSVQESIIVDDLLYVLLGVEGRYIKLAVTETRGVDAARSTRTFKFGLNQPGMDPSLLTLASRCLSLGEFYLNLSLYIEQFSRYEYGQVSHAFCAALKTLLKDIGDAKFAGGWLPKTIGGGSLLSEIQRIMSSLAGDSNARKVFSFLMERASVPYLKMVERWIYHGDLVDPYDEFMIRRDDQVSKEDVQDNPYSTYWQSRYTIRASQVPLFLSRVAQKILTAGKYLNVFRTCSRQVDCPFAGEIVFSPSESVYEELIDKAHGFASRVLLDLFVRENDLLISLKHYFLMDQGDFFVDFMDVAEVELKLRADKLSLPRLESLLHLSLQTSTCSSDPYKDDLQCFLSPHNLISHMEAIHQRAQKGPRDSLTTFESSSIGHPGYKVIDAFTLDYNVKWPLSLVISCGALTKYQMIFRHIFFCKHVERQLCDAWMNHQATKELSLRAALGPSFCLRQRMLHFQQNFVYYMMFEVISPRWHDFQQQLASAGTVDDILEFQGEFLDICLKECLLTDPELLRVLTRLMMVCMTFANSIESYTRPYFLDEETIKAEREAERDRRAEKKAREEAEVALASYQRQKGTFGGKKKGGVLRRRQSSQVDMRRTRIRELSDDVKRALTEREGDEENPFVRMTNDLENQFDSLLGEFMQQLLRRSLLQQNSHLSNLCTRLDYNGFYTKRAQYTCVLLVAVCLLLLGASAKQLTVLVQPLTSTAGESLSVQPVLALTDDNGNILTTENDGTVIVSIGNNPSRFAGIYPLASAFTFENGIARCSGLYINEANVGFTLVFSSYYHGVRTETSSFDVVVGPRYRLAILADISTAYGGTPFLPQPTAGVVDKGGNVVAAVTESSVRIEIEVNPVGGVLQPAALLNVSIVGGIARFRGAFIDVAGSPYKLRYTTDLVLDGGSTVVTNPFTVAAGECSRLQFNTTLGEATGGKAFLIQPVLKLLDSGGNVLEADSSSKVRVTIAANPSRGTLTPADGLTVRVQKGVATFRSLKIDKAGNGYSLQFTLYTKVQGKNTWKKTTISQVSDTFDILTGNPVSLLLQRNLSDGILDGQPNEIQPIVALLDSGGNVVSSLETGTVTASLVSSASVSSSIVVDTSAPLLTVVNVRALINSAYPMAYGVGARVSVQVTFSDEVSIKGAPTLELESSANGAGANGKAVAVTTTTVWSSIYVFEYDVVATDNTLDLEYTSTTALSLNGGLITDRNGKTPILTLPALGSANSLAGTSAVVIDTTAPVITSVSCPTPGDGEYGTGQQINLSVQFSQPVSVYGNPLLPVALTSVSGTGGTRNAVFSSGNNTNTLVFIYTVQSGDAAAKLDVTASINVNGGFIKHCSQRPTTDAVVTMAAVPVKLSSVNNIVIDTATPTIDATVGVTSGTSNGIYAPGDEIKILITFTKPVTVTGYPRLFLETGPIRRPAGYTTGSGTKVLTLVYRVSAGDTAGNGFLNYRDDHALRLNGGTITRSLVGSTGATGVSAVLSLTSATSSGKALANNAQLTIDGLPPTVTRISVSSAPSSTVTRGNEVVIGISFSALVTVDTTKGTPTLQMDVGSYNRQAVYKSGTPTVNGGSFVVGDVIEIVIKMDLEVFIEPPPSAYPEKAPVLLLNTVKDMGAVPRKALYNTGSGTTVLTFIYTVQEGDYSVDMEYVDHHSLDSP